MPRNPTVEFDTLRMFFGEPYVIDVEDAIGTVTVYSPTIGDIMEIGEQKFYQTLNIFICNTTQYRLILWQLGKDWNTFSDFELFVMLYSQADPDVTKLLFGDLDFKKFVPMIKQVAKPKDKKPEEEIKQGDEQPDSEKPVEDEIEYVEELILWDNEDEIEINKNVHNHFSQYLREVFNIHPEEKITQDNTLKSWYITKDQRAVDNAKKIKHDDKGGGMRAIISSLINHPGFKYKLKELKEVGVAEFYDSVKRLQVYEQSTALLKGIYGGMISAKDIKPEDYNFMREIK